MLLSTQVTTSLLSQSSWPFSGAYLDRVASVASYLLLFCCQSYGCVKDSRLPMAVWSLFTMMRAMIGSDLS